MEPAGLWPLEAYATPDMKDTTEVADQTINNTDGLLPPLTPEEYASLRESVRLYGPRSPVLLDQDGHTIDGRNLLRACEELGLECPREVQEFQSDLERLQVALTLNTNRRRWNRKKRRDLVAAYLKLDPAINDNHLAQLIGISKNTVAAVRVNWKQLVKLTSWHSVAGKTANNVPRSIGESSPAAPRRPKRHRKVSPTFPRVALAKSST